MTVTDTLCEQNSNLSYVDMRLLYTGHNRSIVEEMKGVRESLVETQTGKTSNTSKKPKTGKKKQIPTPLPDTSEDTKSGPETIYTHLLAASPPSGPKIADV